MATKQILSPVPGIFYRRSAPGQPAYKKARDPVAVDDVVGLVEIMKTYYEVKADSAGTLARFLVGDQEAVVAGQPLAEIDD